MPEPKPNAKDLVLTEALDQLGIEYMVTEGRDGGLDVFISEQTIQQD